MAFGDYGRARRTGFPMAGGHGAAPAPVPASEPAPAASGTAALLAAFEESGQGWIWETDSTGVVRYLSPAIAARAGFDPARPARLSDLFIRVEDSSGERRTLPFLLGRQAGFERQPVRLALDGDPQCWALTGAPLTGPDGSFTGFRGCAIDITEQRKSSDEASQLAMYDPLTGLPNRASIADMLERSLLALRLQKRGCGVLLVDLDRFKQVNDTLGHPIGDALLVQVARRLQRIVGANAMVARIGGDEFQLVRPGPFTREELADCADAIIASLSEPFLIDGSRCIIGASVGIAVAPEDGSTREELIRNADLALYEAKAAGRGVHRFFSARLLQAAADKRRLEEDLRDALAADRLDVHYQPIVRAIDNVTTGVEALVRWTHPERGPISPAIFIPVAEEANLIEALGEWVLRRACRDASQWPGKLRVAVNVSPIQFTSNLVPLVRSALSESGLAPSRLELEITEGVFLQESVQSESVFAALKGYGVRLALDDFGTGYSSLGYLKTTPFDKIKIDQSFVRAAALAGSRNRAIISAIVALAGALDMETTAEGVETLDQLDLIRQLGVSHVQGYVYSKPVPASVLLERAGDGSWTIEPEGPVKQRADRHSMFRRAGAIIGNYHQPILIRNLSESGALIEGLSDVPIGTLLLIDFGEGQLAFARVRRSMQNRQGIAFEQPLHRDEQGGWATQHRLSAYALSMAGLPTPSNDSAPEWGAEREAELESLRERLGIEAPGAAKAPATPGETSGTSAAAETDGLRTPSIEPGRLPSPALQKAAPAIGGPTVAQLARRLLGRPDTRKGSDLDRFFLEKHILPRFGTEQIGRLSVQSVSSWLAQKAREPGASPARIDRMHALMGQMLMLGMRWDGQTGSTMLDASQTGEGGPRFAERRLSEAEIAAVDTATRESGNLQLNAIIRLMILTGTRQRDVLAARWEQIDLASGQWKLPAGKGQAPRVISLSKAALGLLTAVPRWPDCPWILPNPVTQKPYRSIFNSWDVARQKAGLPDLELDDLRYSMPQQDTAPTSPNRALVQRMTGGGG